MGTKTWWALVTLMVALPGCISVPHVGSMWLDAGDPECAQVRARTHAQPLVFATLIDGALPAWRSRLDAPAVAGSSGTTLARVGVATVRGLSRDASESVTTVLRIERRASDGSIVRTYAYAEGEPGADGAPPAEGFAVARIEGEGLFLDGVVRRGTERAILVGSQADESGAHGVVVFSPGSPGSLLVRAAHCRAPLPEAPSATDAAPPPTVAPSTTSPEAPLPVQVPDRVDVPVQVPMQEPTPTPVPVPVPTAS